MSTIEPTSPARPEEINPYASPRSERGKPEDRIEIKPRVLPRDPWDILIMLAGVVLSIPLIAAMSSMLWYPWQNQVLPVVIFLLIWLPAIFAMLISFSRLTVDQAGIQVHRILGRPRFLYWDDVREIAPVSRREALLRGYLLPPLPLKGTLYTASYLNHFRIETQSGTFYFPPVDIEQFVTAVQRWKADCLIDEAGRGGGIGFQPVTVEKPPRPATAPN